MTDKSSKYSKNYKLSITNPKIFEALKLVISILIGLALTFVILCFVSKDPFNAFITILTGPLKKTRYIGSVIESFIPYAFAGLAAGVLFKSGAFNLGAEGIFIISGVAIAAVAVADITSSFILHPFICILVGALVGGVLMCIPSLLKAKFNTNEMVVSLMLNSIYSAVSVYIVRTYMRDVGSLIATKEYAASARIGYLYEPLRINICLVILLICMVILSVMLKKTRLGYQIRLVGTNPQFSEYSGINSFKLSITTALISGVLCGIGAACHLLSQTAQYQPDKTLSGIGFSGMLLAMLGHNNPIGIVIASFFIKYLEEGTKVLYFVDTSVPSEIVSIVEGVIILLISSQYFLRGFRERKLLKEGLEKDGK